MEQKQAASQPQAQRSLLDTLLAGDSPHVPTFARTPLENKEHIPTFARSEEWHILQRVIDLFTAHPDAWIRGREACNFVGNLVPLRSPTACSWCVGGACGSAGSGAFGHNAKLSDALSTAARKYTSKGFINYNDNVARDAGDIINLCRDAQSYL